MSYIGRGIDQIDNISTLDNLSFNGSLQTFNLTQNSVAFVPVSADALQIQIDGVIQANNFTISGSTLTFDFVPSGSSVCNSVKHFGVGLLTTVSDSSITTAKLGNSAVTDAKISAMASSKLTGVVPTANLGSGTASSSTVLFGDQTYKTAPSGGLVLISNTTSASSVTSVIFDDVFSSTYKNYKIIGEYTAVNSSGDTTSRLQFRTSANGGTNLDGNEYNYHFIQQAADSDPTVHLRATANSVLHWTTNQDDDSSRHGVRFDFTVFDPHSSGRTTISGLGRNTGTDGNLLMFTGACDIQNDSSVTGIKFFVANGNIKDVAIKVYGIVDS